MKDSITETLELAAINDLRYYKRTTGYGYDFEEITLDEAIENLVDASYCSKEEIHDFLADVLLICEGVKGEAEINYDWNSVPTCGDGCCSEIENYWVVVKRDTF